LKLGRYLEGMADDDLSDLCDGYCERPLSEALRISFYRGSKPDGSVWAVRMCEWCAPTPAQERAFNELFERAFEDAYRDGRELTPEDIRVIARRSRMLLQ
jgi:hypothetical protein